MHWCCTKAFGSIGGHRFGLSLVWLDNHPVRVFVRQRENWRLRSFKPPFMPLSQYKRMVPRLPHLLIPQERWLLALVVLTIWLTIYWLEKWMPHPSTAIFVLGVIVLYGILLGLANAHHRRKTRRQPEVFPAEALAYQPKVSVVVPAHNEASVIAQTVHMLMGLDYPDFDVWVIDDRSKDGTKECLDTLVTELNDARFHYSVRPDDAYPGKSAVLNDALSLIDGELILVFDADAVVEPDFLKRLVPFVYDDDVGAVQARKVIPNPTGSLLIQSQALEYLMDAQMQIGRDVIQGAVELRGNGQLIKRAALEDVGGWNEESITDDLDLSTKLHLNGWDIRFAPDVIVSEEGVAQFWPLVRQRRRWAEGSIKRYLEYAFQVLRSPHISHRAQLDMLVYWTQFIFPIWVVSDCVFQVIQFFMLGWPKHPISSLIMMPAMGLFFISGVLSAIAHFKPKMTWWQSYTGAFTTALTMLVVWWPVVLWIIVKILFKRDEGASNWGKTQHFGANSPSS